MQEEAPLDAGSGSVCPECGRSDFASDGGGRRRLGLHRWHAHRVAGSSYQALSRRVREAWSMPSASPHGGYADGERLEPSSKAMGCEGCGHLHRDLAWRGEHGIVMCAGCWFGAPSPCSRPESPVCGEAAFGRAFGLRREPGERRTVLEAGANAGMAEEMLRIFGAGGPSSAGGSVSVDERGVLLAGRRIGLSPEAFESVAFDDHLRAIRARQIAKARGSEAERAK